VSFSPETVPSKVLSLLGPRRYKAPTCLLDLALVEKVLTLSPFQKVTGTFFFPLPRKLRSLFLHFPLSTAYVPSRVDLISLLLVAEETFWYPPFIPGCLLLVFRLRDVVTLSLILSVSFSGLPFGSFVLPTLTSILLFWGAKSGVNRVVILSNLLFILLFYGFSRSVDCITYLSP